MNLTERDHLFEELDHQYGVIREEIKGVRIQKEENQKKMDENNAEMEKVRAENADLIKKNERRDADNKKLTEQLDEALECLKKLEEVRYTMNRLMGPQGVLEDHERYKLLLTKGEYDDEVAQKQAAEGGAPPQAIEAGPASKNQGMVGNNNAYFYNDAKGGNNAAAGGDDDFWYGGDKEENMPLASNQYQSYIAGQGQEDIILGKTGSRR